MRYSIHLIVALLALIGTLSLGCSTSTQQGTDMGASAREDSSGWCSQDEGSVLERLQLSMQRAAERMAALPDEERIGVFESLLSYHKGVLLPELEYGTLRSYLNNYDAYQSDEEEADTIARFEQPYLEAGIRFDSFDGEMFLSMDSTSYRPLLQMLPEPYAQYWYLVERNARILNDFWILMDDWLIDCEVYAHKYPDQSALLDRLSELYCLNQRIFLLGNEWFSTTDSKGQISSVAREAWEEFVASYPHSQTTLMAMHMLEHTGRVDLEELLAWVETQQRESGYSLHRAMGAGE